MIRTALVNLPSKSRVMRRFMCSTNAENYLFPPQELMSLGAIVTKWKKQPVLLIDAIAEQMKPEQVIEKLEEFRPDLIVTMTAFEYFQNDIERIRELKQAFPNAKIVCFGYYPTIFARQLLEKVKEIDVIVLNEPDLVFSRLFDAIAGSKSLADIPGIAFRSRQGIAVKPAAERIANLDELPFPDRSLVNNGLYFEPFLEQPYTTIQSSRGCPFRCNYCVCTYGKKWVKRSASNVLGEIREVVEKFGIRNFRVIDDTFTVDKSRVIEICKGIVESGWKLNWSCLSRVDTLDFEMLEWMKKAGCKRIFIGIESGSQKVLDYLEKGYKAEDIAEKVRMANKAGIETVGWFIVGSKAETKQDLDKSIELAKKCDFDFVVVSLLLCYPGTALFEKLKGEVDFSLLPYKNDFKNKEYAAVGKEREKYFYKKYYFRPWFMARKGLKLLKNPKDALLNFKNLLGFIMSPKSEEREDLF